MFRLTQGIHRMNRWSAWVAAAALLVMMLLVCAEIVGRYMRHPITGEYDMVEWLLLLTTGFAFAYTQQRRLHITIDVLISKFPQRAQAIIDSITGCLNIGLISLILWQSIVFGNNLLAAHVGSMTLHWPLAFGLYIIALVCGMFVLELLVDLLAILAKRPER